MLNDSAQPATDRRTALLLDLRGIAPAACGAARLDGWAHRTPVMTSGARGSELFLKWENLQRASTFSRRAGRPHRVPQRAPGARPQKKPHAAGGKNQTPPVLLSSKHKDDSPGGVS